MNDRERAAKLKSSWMQMPDEFFKTKTFADLEIGDSFICLPQPGDNNGHGGFTVAHRICQKDFAEQLPGSMPVIQIIV